MDADTLDPQAGPKGTKKLIAEYGDQFVCIRYRYDPQKKKRYKTVELIIEEIDWKPRRKADASVEVKVEWGEVGPGPAGEAGWRQVESSEKGVGDAL